MQLMPGTAKNPGFGVKGTDNPWDPQENMRVGKDYLNAMLNRYGGDQEAALIAYNAGPGNADKWVASGRNYGALPKRSETEPYVRKILGGGASPYMAASAQGGAVPAASAPIPQLPVAPNGRYSKLADALMAAAAGAKPSGWGEALNAAGDLALGYSLANKHDTAEKTYRSKLAEALTGAKDTDALTTTLLGSGDPDLQNAAVNLKVAQMKKPEPTGDQREYEMAKAQGFQGSFMDYQTALKKAGASSVNVDTKQESEYEKGRGKALSDEFGKIMTDAQASSNRIGQLKTLDALLSDPNVYTGAGAEAINALKRWGKSFLGLDFEGVGAADTARRVTTEMALSLKSDLPGPMSNADRDFLQSIPPNIGDTAEGRKLLVELMGRKEQRKIEVAKLARQYRAEHQGRLDDGWYEALSQYNEANPMVTPDMIAAAQGAAKTAPQPAPTAGVPDDFKKKWTLE